MKIIEVLNVWKTYRTGGHDVHALKDVTLCVDEREFHCVVGPSGSGKTTLLSVIGGVERSDRGIVRVCGVDITRLSESELAKFRSKNVGFVFQQFYLIPRMSVIENVELPLMLQGVPRCTRRRIALEVLSALGLEDKAYRRVTQLSGGEQQRVAIARAVVARPKVVLADEPTGNLDVESTRKVMDLFDYLNRKHGVTIVMATHNIGLLRYCDRITQLRDGRVVRTFGRDEIHELLRSLVSADQ